MRICSIEMHTHAHLEKIQTDRAKMQLKINQTYLDMEINSEDI